MLVHEVVVETDEGVKAAECQTDEVALVEAGQDVDLDNLTEKRIFFHCSWVVGVSICLLIYFLLSEFSELKIIVPMQRGFQRDGGGCSGARG